MAYAFPLRDHTPPCEQVFSRESRSPMLAISECPCALRCEPAADTEPPLPYLVLVDIDSIRAVCSGFLVASAASKRFGPPSSRAGNLHAHKPPLAPHLPVVFFLRVLLFREGLFDLGLLYIFLRGPSPSSSARAPRNPVSSPLIERIRAPDAAHREITREPLFLSASATWPEWNKLSPRCLYRCSRH